MTMTQSKLQAANQFIQNNQGSVDPQYRNHYHLMAPIGWINDPNGFVYYQGEYHLFYQYYPYDSVWGPMHWGHAKSKDLIDWEHLPVALAPTEDYDADGCFSGSAIEKDGKLYLMYTGHLERDGVKREVQCMAVSEDGINFEKYAGNPVISDKELGAHGDIRDFRDPKVFERDGVYYSVVATKTAEKIGRILMFRSEDLLHWEFFSVLLEGEAHQGVMWECPDLFELDGQAVLLMSPIEMAEDQYQFWNINSTVAFIGSMDWETGTFQAANYHEIDQGLDFYAPQTCLDDQGQRIMVAWMQMWNRNMPTNDLGHKWAGSMTLPRILHVQDQRLVQTPVTGIVSYLEPLQVTETFELQDTYQLSDCLEEAVYLRMTLDLVRTNYFFIKIFGNDSNFFEIRYNKQEALLTIDRSQMDIAISGKEQRIMTSRSAVVPLKDNQLCLELFKDTSSLELFANDHVSMTSTFFETEKLIDLLLESDGSTRINSLEVGRVTK